MSEVILVTRSSIKEMSIEELERIDRRLTREFDKGHFSLGQRHSMRRMIDLTVDEIACKKKNAELDRHSIYWLGDGLLKGAQKQ